jgi:predicted PurR-regulated permease PerM
MTRKKRSPVRGLNQVLLFIVLLFVILHYAEPFLVPVAIGGLMAMLLVPVCRWLEQRRVNRGIAAGIAVLLAYAVIVAVLYVLANQVIALVKDAPSIGEKVNDIAERSHVFLEEHFQFPVSKQKEFLQEKIKEYSDSAGAYVGRAVVWSATFLGKLLIVIIYTLMFLIYRYRLKQFVLQVVVHYSGKHSVTEARDVVEKITGISGAYLAGVFLVILILATVYTIGLYLFGVDNALFFGLLAALINVIPYIGTIVGPGIVVIYALITADSISTPIMLAIFFTVLQQIDSYFLTPKITGGRIQLSPLFTILALLLGGMVWGVEGMLLFSPFLGVAKIIFDHIESLKPYGYLIGTEKE